jgi:hypothetical protein
VVNPALSSPVPTGISEVPWFYSIVRANYAGAITGRFATPPLGFDIYTLAAAKDGVWTTSRNASASTFILVRLSSQGAYSWYSLPSPFGSDVVVPTALAVSGNGTLWFGVSDNNAQGSVVGSFTPNHIITAKPFAVNLISGSTTTVTLSEHAFAGTFTAAVANELSPGNETPCPITVTPASGTTFTLRATGSVPTRCGVTFTDDTGVGSAWVTVNSP